MDRKIFLKSMGLAGLGLTLPFASRISKASTASDPDACTLIPSETAGPFPLDLTANSNFFRQDIRESKTGVQLNLKLKIIGDQNCEPMQNVRVNVWHCDKDGFYSGYDQNNNPGQSGLTYLRGYQITDANGEVEFTTIFPGWYNGRICHIHFQVYVSSSYAAISQLTFDIPTKNALYANNSSLYTKGADPMTFSGDNIFSDGYQYQLATLTPNSTSGGYDSYLEVTVQGSGLVGRGHQEKELSKQFVLGQNYPNPYQEQTTVPLSLKTASEVTLDIWDLSGRKVAQAFHKNLSAGEHQLPVNLNRLGLSQSTYVYQVEVVNTAGVFRESKIMTSMKQ